MALDQWEDKELITKAKMNAMVDAINENTDGVAQGGGSVKSVNGVSPDSKGNVNTPKTDLSGYATKESVTNAQNTANSAQAAVDGLEIGARNYITNSDKPITIGLSDNNFEFHMMYTALEPNQEYVFSSDFQIVQGTPESISIMVYDKNFVKTAANTNVPVSDTRLVFKFKNNADGVNLVVYGGQAGNTSPNKIILTNYKLVKGNVDTDVGPAPEDKADDAKVGHLANDQTWAGVNNFNNLQINGQNLDAYIAAQIAKANGTA